MGMAQGLEVVLEAASQLKDYPIQFKLIGDGVCKTSLIQMAKSMGLSNMTFLDSISREALISEMHNASVCLVPLKNNPLFRNAIPSKIFEIMACKKPVILGVEGEAAGIIQQYNCGTVVSPENPLELKNIILKYYESKDLIIIHGNNGVRAVTEHLRKDVLLSTFLKCVNTTIN